MRLSPVTSPFALLGTAHGGVWTTADATRAGVTPDRLRQLVRSGEWRRVHHGIYVSGGVEPDDRMRAFAAVLAAGPPAAAGRPLRAVASGRTAARLLGLPLVGCPDGDDVVVAAHRHPHGRPGLRIVRSSGRLETLLLDGLPVATAVQVLLDLAPLLSDEALVCVLDAMLHTQRVALSELPASGRWCRRLADVARRADGRAESPLETLGRLGARQVIPDLEPQVRVLGGARRLDLGCRRLRVALEGDGVATHSRAVSLLADRRREDEVPGWRFLRFGWSDVWPSPAGLQQRLRALLARQADGARAGPLDV